MKKPTKKQLQDKLYRAEGALFREELKNYRIVKKLRRGNAVGGLQLGPCYNRQCKLGERIWKYKLQLAELEQVE